MKRQVVRIDEEKCDGCGLCVDSCAEGAIALVDGKARLVSDVYCDGLGACLGDCPQGAISIEEREAAPFDEVAVAERLRRLGAAPPVSSVETGGGHHHLPGSVSGPSLVGRHGVEAHGHGGACPGSAIRVFSGPPSFDVPSAETEPISPAASLQSRLGHWPVQIALVPPHAPFLQGADLLICADCVPFALPGFHQRYLQGRAVLVGCPKLDDLSYYREKFRHIMSVAGPSRVTVLRMEVPCCGGIAQAALDAVQASGLPVPVEIHTIGIRGDVQVQKLGASRAAG